jgi:hypothetical protein
MNINLLKAADKLLFAVNDIGKLIRDMEGKNSFEDAKVLEILRQITEQMRNAEGEIRHFSKPAKEGRLRELPNGRFEVAGIELRCGYPVEIYSDKYREWFDGRVEHANGHYYFYCSDLEHPILYTGMKARVRIEREC